MNLKDRYWYENAVNFVGRLNPEVVEERSRTFVGLAENSELGKTNVLMCPAYEFMGQNQIILEGVKNLFAEPPKARFCLHFTRALK